MPLSPAARYGLHRVLDGPGVFPQPALRLDSDPRISDAELLVDVERLNLDSASFRQLREANGADPAAIAAAIESIVVERGKLHNPVTGSGGMLIGTVREVGSLVRETRDVRPGQRIASLISLTLTPLRLTRIAGIDLAMARWPSKGRPCCSSPARSRCSPTTSRSGSRWPPWTWPARRRGRPRSSSRATRCCWSAEAAPRGC